jgi:outer membrane receptor protein involved in Fe transport
VIHLDEVDNIDNVQVDTASRGYLGELQYLLRTHRIDLISGGGHYSGDQEDSRPEFGQADVRHTNGYFYSYWRYPEAVTWTLGMSVDALDEPSIRKRDLHKINPKLAILWDVTPGTTLRFAAPPRGSHPSRARGGQGLPHASKAV